MESGKRVSAEVLQAVAAAFDTQVSELLATSPLQAQLPKLTVLPRVRSGKQLCDVLASADVYENDYEPVGTKEESDVIGSCLQQLHDVGESWDDAEPAYHVQCAHELGQALLEVEDAGFRVFGARVVQDFQFQIDPSRPLAMSVASFLVLRASNPKILLP